MEDLGPGPSLADSLLTGDRSRVRADLVSYAGALGSMHAWSMGRPRDPRLGTPPWPDTVARGKDASGCDHDGCPGRLDRRLGDAIAKVLEEDDEWGTTTMRPRLLTWLRSFTSAAGRSGVLPGLRVLAGGLHERLSARWPEAVIGDYPALARPGSAQVQVPDFWQPEV